MVAGTYEVTLKTPMGMKKGELVLEENNGIISGKMVALGKENAIEPGKVEGNHFTFGGKLKTPVGMTAYTCEGDVDGDAIVGTVMTKKGNLPLKGSRK